MRLGLATLGVLLALRCGAGYAQPAGGVPVNSIPPAVKAAPAMGDVQVNAIKEFIAYQVPRLVQTAPDATPTMLSAARDRLMAESTPVGAQGAQAFLEEYAQQLGKALAPHVNNPSLRVRLNIAIVVSRVATNSQSQSLSPVIIALLKDPTDPVCMWAMKAAGKVLTSPIAVPIAGDKLLAAVVPAVAAHNYNGAITDEAYLALQEPAPPSVAALLELYGKRVALYASAPPDEPVADKRPSYYLTVAGTWKSDVNATQQQALVQMMSDLMALAGQHAVSAQTPPDKREQLVELLRQTAAALGVVGDTVGDSTLKNACAPTKNWGSSTPSGVVTSNVNAIVAAIKASPSFPGIKPAPQLGPAASAP